MKKIATILASAALLAGVTGCESFLEEESYGSTTDIFNEENGLKAFVNLSYTKINNLYGGDGQWPLMTELGTDIFLARQEPGRYGPYGLLRTGCQQRQCLVAVEPLLQGAGQHQHVHGDHRYDALCQ